MNALRLLGASMRLTRLVIHDDLGQHVIQQPLDALVAHYTIWHTVPDESKDIEVLEGRGYANGRSRTVHTSYLQEPEYPDWTWLRDGATCPGCVGFWITLATVLIEAAPKSRRTASVWRVVTSALALNEAALSLHALLSRYEDADADGDAEADDQAH